MGASSIYIAISIIALAVVAALVFLVKRNTAERRLTPLASLAFGFILAGLLFSSEYRLLVYGLMGVGVLLAVVDIFNTSRRA
jgi:hypothetical protein